MRKLITILGSPLDNLNMNETIDRFVDFVRVGRATHKSHQVATVNVDFLVQAISDPELQVILQEVAMATIDGMPLVWGARWLGTAVQDRVAGSDFVPFLAQRAAQEGLSIFLLGATPEVAAAAAQKLQIQNPGLVIAGVISPPFQPVLEMDPGIVAEIRAVDPDILLVAFGNPKQEKWIEIYGPQVNVPLMIGVGATLDFIAGHMARAPRWMQRTGLEWLFRLLQEPRRLVKRYFKDIFIFGYSFTRQWWLQRPGKARAGAQASISYHQAKPQSKITVKGDLTASQVGEIWALGLQALEGSTRIGFDLEDCTFIDSTATGALMGIAKQARDRGVEYSLLSISRPAQKIFAFHRLHYLFPLRDPDETASENQSGDLLESSLVEADLVNGSGPVVIKAPRRLDGNTSLEFEPYCHKLLERHPYLIVDLDDTLHISSAGLASLDKLTRMARSTQGSVRIISPSRDIRRVIQLQNFENKLSVYPDLSTAIKQRG